MKFLTAILFLLLSISFVAEYTLPESNDIGCSSALEDDANKGTQEQENKSEKESKEKYYSLFNTEPLFNSTKKMLQHQDQYISLSSGYLHQPFTPPDGYKLLATL